MGFLFSHSFSPLACCSTTNVVTTLFMAFGARKATDRDVMASPHPLAHSPVRLEHACSQKGHHTGSVSKTCSCRTPSTIVFLVISSCRCNVTCLVDHCFSFQQDVRCRYLTLWSRTGPHTFLHGLVTGRFSLSVLHYVGFTSAKGQKQMSPPRRPTSGSCVTRSRDTLTLQADAQGWQREPLPANPTGQVQMHRE